MMSLSQGPVYLSFDIDAIDPGFCPGRNFISIIANFDTLTLGTGTPEIGGLTSTQVPHNAVVCLFVVNLVSCCFFAFVCVWDTVHCL